MAENINKTSKGDLTILIIFIMNKSERTLLGVLPHDTLKEHKINFVSLKEQMDTDTGMLMFNMMGSIAEFERCLINRRIYEGVKISGRKKLGHST